MMLANFSKILQVLFKMLARLISYCKVCRMILARFSKILQVLCKMLGRSSKVEE